MKTFQHLLAIALIGAASAAQAQAQGNTTPDMAVPYEVGQGWVTHQFTSSSPVRWFSFGELGRRSYCIEVVQGSLTPFKTNPSVEAFTYTPATGAVPLTYAINQAGATLSVSNDNGGADPFYQTGARACYYSTEDFSANTIRTFKVTAQSMPTGEQALLRIRVVDTTLVARCDIRASGTPVVFLSGNTSADLRWFPYFRGIQSPQQSISFIGTPVTSTPASAMYPRPLGAHGSTFDIFAMSGSGEYGGTCYVAHNGAPGSIFAHVRTPMPDGSTMMVEMKSK